MRPRKIRAFESAQKIPEVLELASEAICNRVELSPSIDRSIYSSHIGYIMYPLGFGYAMVRLQLKSDLGFRWTGLKLEST